jgi:hypothetical protein
MPSLLVPSLERQVHTRMLERAPEASLADEKPRLSHACLRIHPSGGRAADLGLESSEYLYFNVK